MKQFVMTYHVLEIVDRNCQRGGTEGMNTFFSSCNERKGWKSNKDNKANLTEIYEIRNNEAQEKEDAW